MPMLANTIAGAIVKQFPEKFSGDADSAASGLLATLTAALQEHEYLAGIAVDMAVVTKDPTSATFKAAADALDKNSVAIADAVNSVYPGTKDIFLASWRKHIGFFVDYTVGKLTNDTAKAAKAKTRPRRLPGRLRRPAGLRQPQPPQGRGRRGPDPPRQRHLRRHRRGRGR